MHKILFSLLTISAITGCVNVPLDIPGINSNMIADRPSASPVDVGINWGWKIVGDSVIRPVQVFDIRNNTYLQMPLGVNQDVVILVDGDIAQYESVAPYIKISGTPSRIDIVRDGYRAVLVRGVQPLIQAAESVDSPPSASVNPGAAANHSGRVRRMPMPSTAVAAPVAAPLAPSAPAIPIHRTEQKDNDIAVADRPAKRGRLKRSYME